MARQDGVAGGSCLPFPSDLCHILVSFYEDVGKLKMHIEMLRFVHPSVKLEK
jgi:hypothetical protein